MHRYLYVLVIVGAACGYRVFLDYRRKRRVVLRLRARPQLTDAEFADRYFPAEQARIAAELRPLLRRHLPFRLDGLQPGDTFEEDLQISTFCRTAMIEFMMAVEEHFGVTLRHREDVVIRTVGDLVAAIARECARAAPVSSAPSVAERGS